MSYRENYREPRRKSKKNRKKRRFGRILIISIFVVIVGACLAVYGYIDQMLNKINYVGGDTNISGLSSELGNESGLTAAEKAIYDNLMKNSSGITYDGNVFNVLLIGGDTRTAGKSSNSDTMILLSINKSTQKIIMTSFMRDMYCYVPGKGYYKLNYANLAGGPTLLLKTLKANFNIDIDKYVFVDFYSFIDIVDKLGGVDNITVSEAERQVMNDYIRCVNQAEGLDTEDGILQAPGDNLHLTGKQALGYCRIRYVGNSDYERTQRQRTVLTQIINKMKTEDIVTLNNILSELLPDVTTNLDKSEISSLMLSAPTYSKYSLEQLRIPYDGAFSNGIENGGEQVLEVDFDKNIQKLKEVIYNQAG